MPLPQIAARVLPPVRVATIGTVTGTMLARYEVASRFHPRAEREALFDRHMSQHARVQLRVLGIELAVGGARVERGTGARLVVSSHRAATDILIAQALFGGRILSRADIADWPVLGDLARRCGTIFVDRENRSSGAAAIRAIRRALVEGHTVTVFPEGTTSPGDEVRPFPAGVFAALSRLDVEIVPMGVAYPEGSEYHDETFVSHLSRLARRKHTRVGVCVGAPRKAEGRAASLAASLHDEVQTLTHEARRLR